MILILLARYCVCGLPVATIVIRRTVYKRQFCIGKIEVDCTVASMVTVRVSSRCQYDSIWLASTRMMSSKKVYSNV